MTGLGDELNSRKRRRTSEQQHLRRRLRHFFEFMSKVTYLCYFFKILCYFSKILCYFFETLCYFFPNLFGLNKNLFHLSNSYVITPIIMCVCDNICWPTSHRNSIKAKLCCSAAILCCFHHIMNKRVPNSDPFIIISAPTYFLWSELAKNNTCKRKIHTVEFSTRSSSWCCRHIIKSLLIVEITIACQIGNKAPLVLVEHRWALHVSVVNRNWDVPQWPSPFRSSYK